jgi:hypothetical protein
VSNRSYSVAMWRYFFPLLILLTLTSPSTALAAQTPQTRIVTAPGKTVSIPLFTDGTGFCTATLGKRQAVTLMKDNPDIGYSFIVHPRSRPKTHMFTIACTNSSLITISITIKQTKSNRIHPSKKLTDFFAVSLAAGDSQGQ